MREIKQAPENQDPGKIEAFRKMFEGAIEYASQHNVPLCVVEGSCRDTIASIDGLRLLQVMRKLGARV